jgi:bifunctional non-homologous end joining protein LigD
MAKHPRDDIALPPAKHVDQIRPMLLDDAKRLPFSDPEWLFEIKYDGYRMLAEFGAGAVAMRTRRGIDCTAWFPEVAQQLAKYAGGPHIVDGEVCVLDDLGRSDFDRLKDRASRRRWIEGCDPVVYCMFDLIAQGGRDVTGLPLHERKARLERLFTPRPRSALLVVTAIPEEGEAFFRQAVELELEGLTAKRRDSIYRPGERSSDWRKIKRKGAVPAERFRRRPRPGQ